MKRTLVKLFTPIITFFLAVLLVITTFAWYTVKSDSLNQTANIEINATVNESSGGFTANMKFINDRYTLNNDKYEVVNAGGIPFGYCGETGRPDYGSVEDKAYIIFYDVSIFNPNTSALDDVDYAYVKGMTISWEGESFPSESIVQSLISIYDTEEARNNGVFFECDRNAKKMSITYSEGEGYNDSTFSEFNVMMLKKESFENNVYEFTKSNSMVVTSKGNNSISYFLGIQFFNDDQTKDFEWSDQVFVGCKYNLQVQFDSSKNNSYYWLELRDDLGNKKYVNKATIDSGAYNSTDEDNNEYLATFTKLSSPTDGALSEYDYKNVYLKPDYPQLRVYNKLTNTYIYAFQNWVDVVDENGDKTFEYYNVATAGGAGRYDINIKVYQESYKVTVRVPVEFTRYAVKGGYSINGNDSWTSYYMDDISRNRDDLTSSTTFDHAMKLVTQAYVDSVYDFDNPNPDNGGGYPGYMRRFFAEKAKTLVESMSSTTAGGSKGFTYGSHNFDTSKVDNTQYRVYHIGTDKVVASTTFEFCVFSSGNVVSPNEYYYKNVLDKDRNDSVFKSVNENFKVNRGGYDVYVILPVASTVNSNGTTYYIGDNTNAIIIYEKSLETERVDTPIYVRGSMTPDWGYYPEYQFTAVPSEMKKAPSDVSQFSENKKYYTISKVTTFLTYNARIYYEKTSKNINGEEVEIYKKTKDTKSQLNKNYYYFCLVSRPVSSGLGNYYIAENEQTVITPCYESATGSSVMDNRNIDSTENARNFINYLNPTEVFKIGDSYYRRYNDEEIAYYNYYTNLLNNIANDSNYSGTNVYNDVEYQLDDPVISNPKNVYVASGENYVLNNTNTLTVGNSYYQKLDFGVTPAKSKFYIKYTDGKYYLASDEETFDNGKTYYYMADVNEPLKTEVLLRVYDKNDSSKYTVPSYYTNSFDSYCALITSKFNAKEFVMNSITLDAEYINSSTPETSYDSFIFYNSQSSSGNNGLPQFIQITSGTQFKVADSNWSYANYAAGACIPSFVIYVDSKNGTHTYLSSMGSNYAMANIICNTTGFYMFEFVYSEFNDSENYLPGTSGYLIIRWFSDEALNVVG